MIKQCFIGLSATLAVAAVGACGHPLGSDRDAVAEVTIDPPSASVGVGATLPLTATVEDEQGDALSDRRVFWTAQDNSIASVSEAGLVTAHTPGTTNIAATSEGVSDIARVEVMRTRVATVTVLPGESDMSVGSTIELRAVAHDEDGNVLTGLPVVWSSSNPAVATVDDQGRVTALEKGEATITALIDEHSGFGRVQVTGRGGGGGGDDDGGGGGGDGDNDDGGGGGGET